MEWPDVLDHLGKTPREFGALHVHFEAVDPVDRGLVIARVLVQGAFDPMPATVGRVSLFAGVTELGEFPLAALAKGEVLRFSWPIPVPAESTSFRVLVHASEPATNAVRMRPAWKLFDTIEQEKPAVRMDSGTGINIGASLVGTAMMGGAGIFVVGSDDSVVVEPGRPRKVHAARELPRFLEVELGTRTVEPQEATVEVIWAPGQPLPAVAPLTVRQHDEPRKPVRTCRQCDFEDRHAEYARATLCPRCDAFWP